jgi:transposase
VTAVGDGHSSHQVASLFQVSVASVVKWAQRSRMSGSPAAKPMGVRPGVSKLDGERAWLLARLEEKPDLPLQVLLGELRERGVTVSCDTLWRFLRSAGISFKKTVFTSEQDRPDLARRRAWSKKYQGRVDPR